MDEQALEVRSGRACVDASVQQEQSAFLRILSGTVRKQTSMARGTRLHNAKCAMQQQEMAMEHAPARNKYACTSVERRARRALLGARERWRFQGTQLSKRGKFGTL